MPIAMRIIPPIISARLRKRRPNRVPTHIPIVEKMAVVANITIVATTMLTIRKENDMPTAAASMLVAMDRPMRVRVCQG